MTKKLSDRSVQLYSNVLSKIGVSSVEDLQDHNTIISRIESLSSGYKIMAYRAIYNMTINNNSTLDGIYTTKYRELHNNIMNEKKETTLPMTLQELLNIEVKCPNVLQQLVETFTVWINCHHPLRLDYYNVPINPVEKENCPNYMTWQDSILTFYLNDFKNVRSFGSQVIKYNNPIICDYIQALTLHFGYTPKYLLYRYDKPTGCLLPFSSRIMYGGYLQDLFKRHTGHDISINTIRKIHESALIQSEAYSKMSTAEKKKMHRLLLHSLQTAHENYNVVNTNVITKVRLSEPPKEQD
jgi:hypothetical protein